MLTNEEYESALLGMILQDNTILDKIAPTLDDFASPRNKRAFQAVLELRHDGATANLLTVSKKCVGHEAYIAELTNHAIGNSEYYLKELQGLRRKRAYFKLAENLVDSCKDVRKTADEIQSDIEAALLAASEGRSGTYKKISEFLLDVVGGIQKMVSGEAKMEYVPSGLSNLDQIIDGFKPQEYIIIGARPGVGKTSIALNMTIAAVEADKKVGFFSAEMSKDLLVKRMLSSMAMLNGRRLTGGIVTESEMVALMNAAEDLYKRNIYINDTPNIKFSHLVNEARRMRRKEQIDILFVDYMSLINAEKNDVPRHEQVAEMSRLFKSLSRELNIPVVVLSQLTRDVQDKRPSMANLRESGGIEQDADIIVLMWQRGMAPDSSVPMIRVTAIVEKNRNGASGEADLMFRPDITRFYVAERSEESRKMPYKAPILHTERSAAEKRYY